MPGGAGLGVAWNESPGSPPVLYPETSGEKRVPLFVPVGCGFIVFAGLTFVGAPYFGSFGFPLDSGDGPAAPFAGGLQMTAGAWEGSHISVFFSGETDGAVQISALTYLLRGADGMELYSGPAGLEQEYLGTTYSVTYNDRGGGGLVSAGDSVVITSDPTNERSHGGVFRVLSLSLAIRLP